MGQLMNQNSNQGWAGDSNTHDVLNVNLNSQNVAGNYSNISIWVSVYHTGGYSETGTFNGQAWLQGNVALNNTTGSQTIGAGEVTITATWSGSVGHDANGNLSPFIEYYVNQPATSMSRRGTNWGLPRIPLAPPITSVIVDTITPTSARLGAEIGGYGHGTSTNLEMFYRLQGSSTWISLGVQADVAGYNYWSTTGLAPGKTYEFITNATNNNGDGSQSATFTFVTQSIPGMVPILMGLIG